MNTIPETDLRKILIFKEIMKSHWFHRAGLGILAIFSIIMIDVSIRAFTKKSGSTGQDMVQIQQIRYENVILLEETKKKRDSKSALLEK